MAMWERKEHGKRLLCMRKVDGTVLETEVPDGEELLPYLLIEQEVSISCATEHMDRANALRPFIVELITGEG